MKKILLLFVVISSCSRKPEVKEEHTDLIIKKADSVLATHNAIKERNFKVINEVINRNYDSIKEEVGQSAIK